MGLRPVQVASKSGEKKRLNHVIGVDESGNPDGTGGPFVICAVQCPRRHGEKLANYLIDAGLNPWRNKSHSLSTSDIAKATQDRRVESLISSIASTPVTWSSAVGWEAYSVPKRAAITCTVASKSLTTPHSEEKSDFDGDAVLIHDGGPETYGENQQYLRKQASAEFNSSFQSAICAVYASSLPKADLTYPEVIAADYIAGYVRKKLTTGEASVKQLPKQVEWVSSGWTFEDVQPTPSYRLRTSGAKQAAVEQSRVIAWVEGRRPPKDGVSSGRKFENVIENRIHSETLTKYLATLKR